MINDNVTIKVRNAHGTVVETITAKNAVTRAGKEWALRKLNGVTSVAGTDLKRASLEVNVASLWRAMTVASTGRTRLNEVVTLVGEYDYAGSNQRTTTARIVLGTGATAVTFAEFSLPRAHVGSTGGSIEMTWTIRIAYNGVADYEPTEISAIRESVSGETTRQLWIRTTDEPVVQNAFAAILYDASTANPNSIKNGQVRMFKIDETRYDEDVHADAGPFPIVQEDPLIAGTFAVNTVDLRLDFTFSWSGTGRPEGVTRVTDKRWFFMTMGATASTANALRWCAGSHLESDNIPSSATTYTTGIEAR